jgi:hypothetical protein
LSDDDDYELLPRQEIENLKKELERLKKHPLGDMKEGETLLEAINNLNTNIRRLVDLFTKAEAEMIKEYGENSPAQALKSIQDQNEQLAEGLVSVADMVKELKEEKPLQFTQSAPVTRMSMPESDSFGPSYSPSYSDQIPPPPQPYPGLEAQQFPGSDDKKRRSFFRK